MTNSDFPHKLNILMLGPDRSVHGGISAVVNGYYEAGLDTLVNLEYIGTMKEGSKIYKLLVVIGAYLRFVRKLSGADVVHVHAASDNSFLRKSIFVQAARRRGKAIVIHQHGGDFWNWYNNLSDKKKKYVVGILKCANQVLVLSDEWKRKFAALVDEDKLLVFPNSIDVDSYVSQRDFENIVNNKDINTILFLGRICRDKGMVELHDAIKKIAISYPDIKLKVGGIWEEPELEKCLNDLGDNFEYLGWLDAKEKRENLRKASVFVLPSYYEGQPVSVLEAMASGCIIVATNVGGIPMMIEDGVTGYLVEPKQTDLLCDALDKALYNINKMSIRNNARKKVERCYSITNTLDNLIRIWATTL